MLFSIVIPMYNSQLTILRTLNSVKNQLFQDFQVIIVDDGSRDDSVKIVDAFIQANLKLAIQLIKTPNQGVSKARNLGIRKAEGKFIALLDSDDEWHPQKLSLFIPYLTDEYSIFSHGYTLQQFNEAEIHVSREDFKVISFYEILVKNRFVTPSVIFAKQDVFFDESMRHTEDHELWLRLTFKKPALHLNRNLVKLDRPVLSLGGASSNKWKMRKGELKMYINSAKYSNTSRVLLPFLLLFSMLKHLKMTVKL